ncbi:MAG: multicopper oxidase domain-containing protein, partial [Paracoccaceae bacterium]
MLRSGGATAAALAFSRTVTAASTGLTEIDLRASPGRAPLIGPPYPDTPVWCYNNIVPGPEIRVRQGDRVRIVAENGLAEDTTIHWHGIRTPNAMDGVPYLTQKPIAPGE